MANYNFYLNKGETFYEDKKKLRFVSVKNPSKIIKFTDLLPDEAEEFVLVPNNKSNKAPEKLYRILTDLGTVFFLTDDSFKNITKQVNKYLMENEDFERLCVIRDIISLHDSKHKKKMNEVQEYIKKHDK